MKRDKNFNAESLGIGLTSLCNLNCPHCYSKNLSKDSLTLNQIKKIVRKFPNLKKVNFGTGESILNLDLLKIIDFFLYRKIKIAMTSNGFTIIELPNHYLKKINEVDISLDFPQREIHDSWRGTAGVYDGVITAIEKCKKLGVEVSIASVLMNINYKFFGGFRKLLDKYNIYLRVNLYKSVHTDKYKLNYRQFWEAIKIISKNFTLVSNSEPILSLVVPLTNPHGSPCGDSLRVHPDLSISPCVYIDGNKISVDKFNRLKKIIPEFCKRCNFIRRCQGGCLSRKIFEDRIDRPDSYCPLYRGDKIPKIKFDIIEKKDFIHSSYLCTFILK
jgi:radical SAM protein with 4Fe4S-binding SPASM domain